MNNQINKRDFGSFFSSNVEELVRLSDDDYRPLDIPVKFNFNLISKLQYGHKKLKEELFYLNDDYLFLNHGAFGCTFKPTIDYNHSLQQYSESQPLCFYDREVMPLMVHVIRRLADILHCKPYELVLVENCTFAFSSILGSLNVKPHDKILIFNVTYGVYKKILKKYCLKREVELVEEEIEFPLLSQNDVQTRVIDKFNKLLDSDKIKYVFFDYIPSNHSFIMPLKSLIDLCKSKRPDVIIIVDAAHAFGSIVDLNLSELNAHIVFGNCHKWLCGPKGTGFLYKNPMITLKPCVLSHGLDAGFHSEFMWIGLKDYCSFLALHSTLDLWLNHLGGFKQAISYCNNLAKEASMYLKNNWRTQYLVHPDYCASMVLVKLPFSFIKRFINSSDEYQNEKITYDHAEKIQNYLHFKYRIEVPIKAIQNDLYVRISCHIYNNLNDYKHLCDVIIGDDDSQ